MEREQERLRQDWEALSRLRISPARVHSCRLSMCASKLPVSVLSTTFLLESLLPPAFSLLCLFSFSVLLSLLRLSIVSCCMRPPFSAKLSRLSCPRVPHSVTFHISLVWLLPSACGIEAGVRCRVMLQAEGRTLPNRTSGKVFDSNARRPKHFDGAPVPKVNGIAADSTQGWKCASCSDSSLRSSLLERTSCTRCRRLPVLSLVQALAAV